MRPKSTLSKSDRVRANQIKHHYGVTSAQYALLLAKNGGKCHICGGEEKTRGKSRLSVDHDHVTGRVRGLLCGPCNKGLGMFRDNPFLLRCAATYVS